MHNAFQSSKKHLFHGFLLLFIFTGPFLACQTKSYSSAALHIRQGTVIQHTISGISDRDVISATTLCADIGISSSSYFSWAKAYNNPIIGVSVLGSYYSDPSINYGVSVLGFLSNRYVLYNSPLFFHYHTGLGLSYIGNVFDIKDNYTNESVSTHLNAIMDLRAGIGLKILTNWNFFTSVNLLHSSNMGFRKPNYGINLIDWSAGLSYEWNIQKEVVRADRHDLPNQELLITGHVGTRQIAYQDPYLLTGNINLEYNRLLTPILRGGIGGAGMEDGILYEHKKYLYNTQGESYRSLNRWQALSLGTHLNLELIFNRLSLVGQCGYYWYHPHRNLQKALSLPANYLTYIKYTNKYYVYNRLGFRYRFQSNFVVSITGKTQLFKIQFMEFGLGYSI